MSELAPGEEHPQPPAPEPPDPGSDTAPDPEDWASTAISGDDERYLRDRPPHWQ